MAGFVSIRRAFRQGTGKFVERTTDEIRRLGTNRVDLADADLGAVAPSGRQVELLAMVEPDHRVSAWKVALAAFEKKENSVSEAKRALRNYCDEHDTVFGRRKLNGSKKGGHGLTQTS